ncbi:MAG: type II toxin-antitoxin system PemK/MazF family toxin [Casimicrobium sp.]|jgi:mRNA interferase MazF
MVSAAYVPHRGDVVWIDFDPQAGHEQAGRRPALILSDKKYNARSSLVVLCPITSQLKPYPFVVALPPTLLPKPSYVLADQVKSLDWRQRDASFIIKAPINAVDEVTLFAVGIVQGRN